MTEKRKVKWPGNTEFSEEAFDAEKREDGGYDVLVRSTWWVVPSQFTKPEIPDDELVVWVDGGGSRRLNKFGSIPAWRKQAAKRLYLDVPEFEKVDKRIRIECDRLGLYWVPEDLYRFLVDVITNGTGKTANPDLEA
jgi:hypothetical protein